MYQFQYKLITEFGRNPLTTQPGPINPGMTFAAFYHITGNYHYDKENNQLSNLVVDDVRVPDLICASVTNGT